MDQVTDRRAYMQQWEKANAERRRAYWKQRYHDNIELRKAQVRDYYMHNKPRFRAAYRRYAQRHKLALKIARCYGVSMAQARQLIAGQAAFEP